MSVALSMARTTRLVAIGLRRTKSALPINMQQKYCDHGRSTALLKITSPVPTARVSCAPGRERHERIDLFVGEKSLWIASIYDPIDVLDRIETHAGGDDLKHDVFAAIS